MKSKPAWFYEQSGVIPYRVVDGRFEILLITSRHRGRWIIPKGIIEPGFTPAASAQKEAKEEAGIVGSVSAAPVGMYQYAKWGGACTVQVFALEVHTVWDTWPEVSVRKRQWMALDDAAHAVREPELQQLSWHCQQPCATQVVRESLRRCGTLRSVHPYAGAPAPSTSLTRTKWCRPACNRAYAPVGATIH